LENKQWRSDSLGSGVIRLEASKRSTIYDKRKTKLGGGRGFGTVGMNVRVRALEDYTLSRTIRKCTRYRYDKRFRGGKKKELGVKTGGGKGEGSVNYYVKAKLIV